MGTLSSPKSNQRSTPISKIATLVQKLFRGEPAITRFVWHVTANLESSHNFVTLKSSDLRSNFLLFHPAQG